MSKPADNKIVVVFQAVGGAPILQQPKVKLSGDSKFSKLVAFLRKQLKTDSVFVYLREAFCPSLDDEAYGIDGKLHVSYALTPAWG
ncbi:MAG: autophagy protein [Monoraphidium minutum]|nr:MAG: autophagy protein [Monoraphidium minutum]